MGFNLLLNPHHLFHLRGALQNGSHCSACSRLSPRAGTRPTVALPVPAQNQRKNGAPGLRRWVSCRVTNAHVCVGVDDQAPFQDYVAHANIAQREL